MSTHPNAMLMLVLKPDDLARKTHRAICEEAGADLDDSDIKIGANSYHALVMEDTYDSNRQISANEGDIVLFDFVTYGYGDRIAWDDLVAQKTELEKWAAGVCERHHCTAAIYISANYW